MNEAWLVSKLANRDMDDYYRWVMPSLTNWQAQEQRGKREGSTVAEHLVGGAWTLFSLKNLLQLTELETRLLVSAYTLHDLNKLEERPVSFGTLADDENLVEGLIERLGIEKFFREWQEYYHDIISLVRGHSGHFNLYGYDLVPSANKTVFKPQRLEELTYIIQAVDIIDMSRTYEEQQKKHEFLRLINSCSTTQFKWVSHKIGEHRGVLTNLIHNQIVAAMQTIGARPLLVYPEGVWYLAPAAAVLPPFDDMIRQLAGQVANRVESLKVRDISKVVRMTKDGIKMNASVLGNASVEDVYARIEELAFRRKPKIQDHHTKLRNRLLRDDIKVDDYLKENNLRLFEQQEEFVGGELIRAAYNLMRAHFTTEISDPWAKLYKHLEIDGSIYEAFNILYDRPYMVAANLPFGLEDLSDRLRQLWEEVWDSKDAEEDRDVPEFWYRYLYDNTVITGGDTTNWSGKDFEKYLQAYIDNPYKQDCYSSFAGPTEKMRSPQVPGITVQQFSNRLPGGKKTDPVRYVSEITREQFFVERVVFAQPGGSKKKSVYLHFMPRWFIPWMQLDVLRQHLVEMAQEEDVLLGFDDNAFKDSKEKMFLESFRSTRSEGLSLPRRAETVAGVISIPVYVAGENSTERSFRAVEYGARMALEFNLKVLISDSVVPPFSPADFDFLYVDNVSWQMQAFLGGGNLSRRETEEIVLLLDCLRSVDMALRKDLRDELLVDLALEGVRRPLGLFNFIDRALEKKARGAKGGRREGIPGWTVRTIDPYVRQILSILERRIPMAEVSEYLKNMAKLGWKSGIRGQSLERNALLFPMNEIFSYLRKDISTFDRDAQKAVLSQNIFDYLRRTKKEYAGKKMAENATTFVNTFFNLVDDIYQGKINRVLDQEKDLKAAYLYYVRAQIGANKNNLKEGAQ
jgi:CRISPR-associated protein Csc3